jgi:hypothetical protein
MPKTTDLIKADIQTAMDEFFKSPSNDRLGGILLDIVTARAMLEILESLKSIQAALEPIGRIFAEAGEAPLKLAVDPRQISLEDIASPDPASSPGRKGRPKKES